MPPLHRPLPAPDGTNDVHRSADETHVTRSKPKATGSPSAMQAARHAGGVARAAPAPCPPASQQAEDAEVEGNCSRMPAASSADEPEGPHVALRAAEAAAGPRPRSTSTTDADGHARAARRPARTRRRAPAAPARRPARDQQQPGQPRAAALARVVVAHEPRAAPRSTASRAAVEARCARTSHGTARSAARRSITKLSGEKSVWSSGTGTPSGPASATLSGALPDEPAVPHDAAPRSRRGRDERVVQLAALAR